MGKLPPKLLVINKYMNVKFIIENMYIYHLQTYLLFKRSVF